MADVGPGRKFNSDKYILDTDDSRLDLVGAIPQM